MGQVEHVVDSQVEQGDFEPFCVSSPMSIIPLGRSLFVLEEPQEGQGASLSLSETGLSSSNVLPHSSHMYS